MAKDEDKPGEVDPAINELPPMHESNEEDDEGHQAHIRGQMKKAKRKERQPESHDDELNIVALMDAFTIILVFLIKSYASDPTAITQSKDLKIPESKTTLSVVEAVPLVITKHSILVNDKTTATLNEQGVEPNEKEGQLLIPRVRDALIEEAKHNKLIAQYNSKVKFEGILLVVADKDTQFHTITEVLYTAGQAEFANYKFAVLKNE